MVWKIATTCIYKFLDVSIISDALCQAYHIAEVQKYCMLVLLRWSILYLSGKVLKYELLENDKDGMDIQ